METEPVKEHEIIAAATNMAVTLENVLSDRDLKKNRAYTGQFGTREQIKAAVEKIRRGVDEARELCILDPSHADRYRKQLGEIAAHAFAACKCHGVVSDG